MDETPEEFHSASTGVPDHKVLGETPEAVKPCLEEYEQDSKNYDRMLASSYFYVKPSEDIDFPIEVTRHGSAAD